MMTPDLTPQDVFAACEEVMVIRRLPRHQIKGHMVWKHLGRGSKTTAQRYTKEWRDMSGDGSPATSTSLVSVLALIERSISGLVDNAVQEEAERARLREAVSTEQITPLTTALANAHITIENLKNDLAAANNAADHAQQELEEARERGTELTAQVQVLTEHLASLVTGQIPSEIRSKIGSSYLDDILKPRRSAPERTEDQPD